MSLESALARISELQSALAGSPPARARPAAPAIGPSFQTALDGAMATPSAAPAAAAPTRSGLYPNLRGDLDAAPELLARLDALAARRGEVFTVTSGHRSIAEQQRLWDNRHSNPYPVAEPGTSRHHSGRAADVTIGGRAIQDAIPAAELRAAGLVPLAGDAVHVELP